MGALYAHTISTQFVQERLATCDPLLNYMYTLYVLPQIYMYDMKALAQSFTLSNLKSNAFDISCIKDTAIFMDENLDIPYNDVGDGGSLMNIMGEERFQDRFVSSVLYLI